jgi:tRNA1(Val) A37 N6-methylase TrmN6
MSLSFLVLFLELALIKWTGDNVFHLSFFSNFVLLGSFLGIGIGFLRAHRPRSLFKFAPVALAVLVAFIRFFPVKIEGSGGNLIFFSNFARETGPPRELTLTVIFVAVAVVMALVAEGLARAFAKFEPLEAYRLDLVGSVAGILAFSALAFLRAPSLAWGAVAVVLLLGLDVAQSRGAAVRLLQLAALVSIIVLLATETFTAGLSWSPYYKIERHGGVIYVNGVFHQTNVPSSTNPTYSALYDHLPTSGPGRVLVIGAGGGNDVAVALARGATEVDAVEIDPRLQEIGAESHPDHPYQDPRVRVHINDGRAFLEQTSRRWDLILFALPDSLVLVPGQSTVRLESYLFTKQAIEAAKAHLSPHGFFSMYNYYREDWLVDRLGRTLDEVFRSRPCIDRTAVHKFALFVAAQSSSDLSCTLPQHPLFLSTTSLWHSHTGRAPAPATDDHPFPYLRTPSLPSLYVVTIALVLAASLLFVRVFGGSLRGMRSYTDLFFMGVAFLLLETKNVVQFALLFGTTWFVNALVFLGILLTVLLAVEISRLVAFRKPAWLYLALLGSIAVAWAVPQSSVLGLPLVARFLAATALAFAPIFIANLVFTQRFRDVGSSTTAFGANLLGAMVGGLLEYSALLVGYRALLIVVAGAYGAAFFFGRSHFPGAGAIASRA